MDTESLWKDYNTEKQAAAERRDTDLAAARARLAAGGARPGTGAWTAAETRVMDAYTKSISDLTSSAAVKALMEEAGVDSVTAMEDYYGRTGGKLDTTPAPTAASPAPQVSWFSGHESEDGGVSKPRHDWMP